MRTEINDPNYPLGIKGKDFLVKIYLEMIAWMTIRRNLMELLNNAHEALGDGEHFDQVSKAMDARFGELFKIKRGIY